MCSKRVCESHAFANSCLARRSYATGYKLTELKDKLARIGIKHVLVHFDCCHAGGIFLDTRAAVPHFVLDRCAKAPVVQGVTAVTADELAIELNGHGLLTHTICDQLESGAIFEMYQQPYVTSDQLFSRIVTLVMEEAQKRRHTMTPMHKPILARHGDEQCSGQMLFVRPQGVAGVEESKS